MCNATGAYDQKGLLSEMRFNFNLIPVYIEN